MVNPTYPGVYVQEVSSGVRPIQAVGTSTAAFVGVAEMGPVDDAHRISSWTEYQRLYGSFTQNGYLAEGVFQFFNNGGRDCYVVRVAPEDAVAASAMVKNRAGAAGVEFTATSPGEWGNCLVLTIEDSTPAESDLFTISVRRQEDPGVIPKDFLDSPPLEIHDQLGMDPAAPNFVETVLARNSQLITAKVHDANTGLEPGVHVGGKGAQLPLGDKRSFQISLDGDGLQTVTLEGPVSTLDEIATAIETAVKALHKKKASTSDKAFSDFSCKVEGSEADAHLVLKSGTTASPQSSVVVEAAATNNATRLLKIGEPDGVSRFAFATRRPEAAKLIQLGDAVDEAAIADVTPGTDGTGKLTVPAFEKGFGQLDNKTDFSLLAVPGESSPQMFSAGVNYCENKRPLRDVFFIGETADHDVDADAALEFAGSAQKSSYGAVYFPWIKASDPSGKSSEPVLLPPSG